MLFTSRGRHGSPVPFYCQRSAPRHCRVLTLPMSAQIALCTILSTIAMDGRRRDRHLANYNQLVLFYTNWLLPTYCMLRGKRVTTLTTWS